MYRFEIRDSESNALISKSDQRFETEEDCVQAAEAYMSTLQPEERFYTEYQIKRVK